MHQIGNFQKKKYKHCQTLEGQFQNFNGSSWKVPEAAEKLTFKTSLLSAGSSLLGPFVIPQCKIVVLLMPIPTSPLAS